MGIEKPHDLKIPIDFLKMSKGWESLPHWRISNNGINVCLAINSFNEKLKELTTSQLRDFDNDNVKLANSWIRKGMINPNCRGVPKL